MLSFLEPSEEAFHLVTNFFFILTLNFRWHQHFHFVLGTFELLTILIHFPSNVTLWGNASNTAFICMFERTRACTRYAHVHARI